MKKHTKILLFTALVFLVTGLVIVAIIVSGVFDKEPKNTEVLTNQQCSSRQQVNHTFHITNNAFTPAVIHATQCDTLTVINQDNKERLLAFGQHDQHMPYDGVSERVLHAGESFQVTLVQNGEFIIHDHLQDETEATFTVNTK